MPHVGKIRKLEGNIVNQIAAGEVVVQPCSVIKELVENAIDAGATQVEVKFDGGGADGLSVIDDGFGMAEEDLILCIEAHATSKITSAADLYSVTSCGFRGEALASISEVSRFEIISRSEGSENAIQLYRDNTGAFKTKIAYRNQGTTVQIRDLFHNVPVRRRFLKTDRAEATKNIDTLKKLAISRPWIGFHVKRDGNTTFELPRKQSLLERVKDLGLFDKKTGLLEIDDDRGELKVHGIITEPPAHFGNAQKIHLFVNHRPITDKGLNQALIRAYSSYIPERRFPGGVIFLDLDPEEVDVNIHPTKSEVRFRQSDVVFKAIYSTAKDRLLDTAQIEDASETQTMVYKSSGLAKTVPMNRSYGGVYEGRPDPFGAKPSSSPSTSSSESPTINLQPRLPSTPSSSSVFETEIGNIDEDSIETHQDVFDQQDLPKAHQVLNRFILMEFDDHFELMDQHAIHERILYNQLAHEDRKRNFVCQHLLVPSILDLPDALDEITDILITEFRSMGYELEMSSNGPHLLEVKGVPDFMKVEKGLKVLESMLAELADGFPPDKDDLRRTILHSAACRSAVKAGDPLTQDELRGMVAATLTMDSHQGCCPHGRNARWRISIAEANNMFNR
jgi:DNA mismatch repair protein MutL